MHRSVQTLHDNMTTDSTAKSDPGAVSQYHGPPQKILNMMQKALFLMKFFAWCCYVATGLITLLITHNGRRVLANEPSIRPSNIHFGLLIDPVRPNSIAPRQPLFLSRAAGWPHCDRRRLLHLFHFISDGDVNVRKQGSHSQQDSSFG